MNDLEQRLRGFLRDELGVDEDLSPDDSLITSGRVDSAGLVRLAALLERQTGLIIPDRDLTPEHFDTIARIVAYVGTRGLGR
jgi:acyl carrier protein